MKTVFIATQDLDNNIFKKKKLAILEIIFKNVSILSAKFTILNTFRTNNTFKKKLIDKFVQRNFIGLEDLSSIYLSCVL